MKTHPRALAEAEITPARYAELRAICRQYQEMRRAVTLAKRYGHHRWLTGSKRGADEIPEARRVRCIEDAAAKVGGKAIERAIIKSVTEGRQYYSMRPPCGERQFYEMRLRFYIELDMMLWESERE